jgi:hypothetical protein
MKEGSPLLSNEEIVAIMKLRSEHSVVDQDLSRSMEPYNVLDQFFG